MRGKQDSAVPQGEPHLLGLPTGIEPATFRLQGGRTTYCATGAFVLMFSGDTGRSRTDRKGIALFTELQSAALPFGYSISTEHQFL